MEQVPSPTATAADRTETGSSGSFDGLDSLTQLKKLCGICTTLIATFVKDISCDIHERCDGHCGTVVSYQDNPLIDLEGLLMSMLLGITGDNSTKATSTNAPRDLHWLEQQKPATLVYSPINSLGGEIRLLRVKDALFRADIVECDLVTVTLGQCEDFTALSYCWGSGTLSEVLLCNGKRHSISASLNAALKASREGSKIRGSLIWADAVSIDQGNEFEKSEQIPLMRRIYTEARACFVYLGEGQPLVTQGLELMLRLSAIEGYLETPEKHDPIQPEDLLSLLPAYGHTSWVEYLRIFTSPWFCRTWTLQEIALSKNALMGVGRFVLDWECVEKSFRFLHEQQLLMSVGLHFPGAMENTLRFIRIQEIKKIARSPDPSSALINVLRATRHFKVTDPRDKVLGVLGVLGDLPKEVKSLIDYKLNTGEIYHRAALYLLKTRPPPDILAHAGLQRQSGLFDMPSWVPDWYSDDKYRNERPLMLFRPESFMAGGQGYTSQIEARTSSPPRELTMLGFCHHRVSKVSIPYEMKVDPTFTSSNIIYTWLDSARACFEDSEGLVYDDFEEAIARTLVVDDLYNGLNATMNTTEIKNPKLTFRAALTQIEEARTSDNPGGIFGTKLAVGKNDEVQTYIMQMTAAMRGRRFGITVTGYTCLVPACTEIGDAVAIFFGHPTPFTVRLLPSSGSNEVGLQRVRALLVGDTYMHGVMKMESIKEAIETGRKACEIILV